MKKGFFIILALLASVTAQAFPPVPKESATALRRTKGKTISTGLVFVNGKFLRPPYVVERWGTGIRINGTPVTGQVISWSEFLKTQDPSAVAVEAAPAPRNDSAPGGLPPPPTDEPPAETTPAPAADDAETMPVAPPEPANDATLDEILSLDDLFDAGDDAASKKPAPKASKPKPKAKPRAPKPKAPPPPEMKLAGAFVKNDASKALVAKINAARTEIDRQLRNGALLCFGDNYARIVGDAKAAELLLKTLPDAEMKAESAEDLQRMLRAARLDYLHELIIEDFFANRIDYRRLQDYRKKLREDREMDKMIEATKKSF